ncbi:SH3 domain-containing protein [Helicobacter cholecystus]|uniref:SH3 domain-containing protein n=1 Tax=Helicobacter cholecystus TaxID=45498 RepID=A0A3D8IXD1_9HELI|nr:SH3 domain-containing protein [Helicobacter cholecystus]RDU69939.1 SH3 domain-containing protein [Helicobacter cholecystus]VEJ24896.1 Bacterial SH3 domain [Helicobacter cholecystus]
MNLDLHAKSPLQRVRLFLKLYSLPVFVAIFGIATYCMAYEKAHELKTQETLKTLKPQINIAQVQAPIDPVLEVKNQDLGEYFVEASVLNVRSQASIQSKINAKLHRSDSVKVLALEGEWAQLENGWVLLKYLSRV